MAHERQTRDSDGQDSASAQAIVAGHYENARTARKELAARRGTREFAWPVEQGAFAQYAYAP